MGTFPAPIHATTSELSRLARTLMEAATAPQLGDSTVQNGAIIVLDEDGNERARFGRLLDGSWGVAIQDSAGNSLPLSQLMQQVAGKASGTLTFGPSGTLAANAWYYDTALSQTVSVTTGQLSLTVSARLMVTDGKGDLTAGYRIVGPTNVAATRDVGLQCYYNLAGMDAIVQGSWSDLVTDLSPGTYTITPAYYLGSVGTPAAYGEVSRRVISVMPF